MAAAIEDPIFQPARRIISAITNANPAAVTTTFDHDYFTGDIVRLIIPVGFGMTQADELVGEVTVTGDDTFTINIDTTKFDSFSDPSNGRVAQVIPVGEVNSTFYGATENTLPSRVR
jgi:hypothetical protein